MLARSPLSATMALIEQQAAAMPLPASAFQPAFRTYWRAPKNSKGGFLSFADMQREDAARRAAYYGPPAGPCSNFLAQRRSGCTGACLCGWHEAAHHAFAKAVRA